MIEHLKNVSNVNIAGGVLPITNVLLAKLGVIDYENVKETIFLNGKAN